MRRISLLLLIAAGLLFPARLLGDPSECAQTPSFQNGTPGFTDCKGKFTALKDASGASPANVGRLTLNVPALVQPAGSGNSAVDQSNEQFAVWRNDFVRRTYESQFWQTRVIFVVVLALVAAGLFFSWVQFQSSMHLNRAVRSADTGDDQASETGADAQGAKSDLTPMEQISLGKDGLVIHSAYLGVIILAVSMAFFFLYLKYVYPIS